MIWRIIGAFFFVLAFDAIALLVLLQIQPAFGIVWIGVLGAAFLWWYLRDSRKAARWRAKVRLRPPRGPTIWVGVGIHTIWNLSMVTLGKVHENPASTYGDMGQTALVILSIISVASGLAGWYAILRAGRTGIPGQVRPLERAQD